MPTCQRCLSVKPDSEFPKKKKEFCSYCSRRIREIRYRNSKKGKETQERYVKSQKRKKYEESYRKSEKRISYMQLYKEKMRKKYRQDKQFRESEIQRRLQHFKENQEIKKEREKRYTKNNIEKQKARTRLRMAVHRGTIIKPSKCEVCNKEAERIEGHHKNYSKPFDVIWMCEECHKIEHGKILDDCT